MSEIEKMYENAGILKKRDCEYPNSGCERVDFIPCELCAIKKDMSYPPFTAVKQLELIKFLMEQEDFSWTIAQQGKDTEYAFYVGYEHGSGCFKEFAEALAGIINNLWQDLTPEEKQQIKEILDE